VRGRFYTPQPFVGDSVSVGQAMVRWDLQKVVDEQARDVLALCRTQLVPAADDTSAPIRRHAWRNQDYLGVHAGRVQAWIGLSMNPRGVAPALPALTIDTVQNALSWNEQVLLFGQRFADAVKALPRFVAMYVGRFPRGTAPQRILDSGFVPREVGSTWHACVIAAPDNFLAQPGEHWSGELLRIVQLQHALTFPSDQRGNITANH
jgi:hypothetical protein